MYRTCSRKLSQYQIKNASPIIDDSTVDLGLKTFESNS